MLRALLPIGFTICFQDGFSQDISKQLINTWYAVRVGEPEGGEMNPTKRKEVFMFKDDGSLTIKDGDYEIPAKWEYVAAKESIEVTITGLDGKEKIVEVIVREISNDKLVLISPQNATEYSTSPPDINTPKPRTAPLMVNSASNMEPEKWTGLHPFNRKIVKIDSMTEKTKAIGVLILLYNNGKKIVRINEDGLTTDVEVGDQSMIEGEIQVDLVSEDPAIAGKIIFREDNTPYFLREEDGALIDYIRE